MKYLLLLLGLLATGCPRPLDQPYTPEDPAPVPEDTNWCDEAGERVEELECLDRAGEPMWINKHGETFAQICVVVQEEGRIGLDPQCIAKAVSCEELKRCPVQ